MRRYSEQKFLVRHRAIDWFLREARLFQDGFTQRKRAATWARREKELEAAVSDMLKSYSPFASQKFKLEKEVLQLSTSLAASKRETEAAKKLAASTLAQLEQELETAQRLSREAVDEARASKISNIEHLATSRQLQTELEQQRKEADTHRQLLAEAAKATTDEASVAVELRCELDKEKAARTAALAAAAEAKASEERALLGFTALKSAMEQAQAEADARLAEMEAIVAELQQKGATTAPAAAQQLASTHENESAGGSSSNSTSTSTSSSPKTATIPSSATLFQNPPQHQPCPKCQLPHFSARFRCGAPSCKSQSFVVRGLSEQPLSAISKIVGECFVCGTSEGPVQVCWKCNKCKFLTRWEDVAAIRGQQRACDSSK